MSEIEVKAWLETIDRIVPPLEPVHENFVAEWALWQDRRRIREELAALVEKPAVFASRYDEQLGECVPVEVDPPMLAKLRERVAVERKAEPVAYASSKEWRKNHLMSAAQYKSALSKNIVDFDIPLYAHPPTAQGTVAEEMRVAACRSLNERGKGNNVTICDVVAMLEAALSASPSPVDSRELIERLVKDIVRGVCELQELPDPDHPDTIMVTVDDLEAVVTNHLAALAAKEQQP